MSTIAAMALSMATMPERFQRDVTTLPSGDLVLVEGQDYHWREADGGSQLSLWVPDVEVVRGLLIFGHGGGSGDSRDKTRDLLLRTIANRYDFGLMGLHRFPGRQVYEVGAPKIFEALEIFSQIGDRPELRYAPIAMMGSSNGGATSYALASYAPERTLCFVTNVAPWLVPDMATSPAHSVPGTILMGRFDPFTDMQRGVAAMRASFDAAREQGARWSFVDEAKGHEDGATMAAFVRLLDWAVENRYPAGADPSQGPVELIDTAEEDGWLGDPMPRDGATPDAVPFGEWEGDRAGTSWMPDRSTASLWQAAATQLEHVSATQVTREANVLRGTLQAVGGPKLRAVLDEDGNDVTSDDGLGFAMLTEVDSLYQHAFVLRAELEDGSSLLLDPVMNPDPFIYPSIDGDTEDELEPAVSVENFAEKADLDPARQKEELTAYRIDGTGEQIEAFWSDFGPSHDAIWMTPATNTRLDNAFSIVHGADAEALIRAAYDEEGLYLLFQITDNRFTPSSDRWEDYHDLDAIDVLIDPHPVSWFDDNVHMAINLDWGLWLSSSQIQVAYGDVDGPTRVKINRASPFELRFDRTIRRSWAESAAYGLRIGNGLVDPMRRVQQWFLPWSEVGAFGGLPGMPPEGTRIAFSPSINDTDDGGERKTLAWIRNTTPWNHSAQGGTSPRGWGEIVIGPRL